MDPASKKLSDRGVYQVDCIVGARPNLMKIAPILRAIASENRCVSRLIHTGQHYDDSMSGVFFDELGIRPPDINLGIGSGTGTEQTARIMLALEPILAADRPDMLMVVGDVNSTLAAGLVASKLLIPVTHVEAGLRSNDRTMPEEINRLVVDRVSDLLLTTDRSAVEQLIKEGVDASKVHFVGNVMIDTLLAKLNACRPASETIAKHGSAAFQEACERNGYGLVTLHRPSNVDHPGQLSRLVESLVEISGRIPLIFPMHPRTRARMEQAGLLRALDGARLLVTQPLGYVEMLGLMKDAHLAITDSGGIQEETTALGVPCLTVRDNTERPVTITEGTNVLVGSSATKLRKAAFAALSGSGKRGRVPELWDGRSAERVVARVVEFLDRSAAQATQS